MSTLRHNVPAIPVGVSDGVLTGEDREQIHTEILPTLETRAALKSWSASPPHLRTPPTFQELADSLSS